MSETISLEWIGARRYWMADIDEHRIIRLEGSISRLEGSYDALKVVRPMTITVIGIFLAAQVFVLSFLSVQVAGINTRLDATSARLDAQVSRLDAKIDAIPALLQSEFRAMRAETAAQTAAIANAITAARQMQTAPPAPVQPK